MLEDGAPSAGVNGPLRDENSLLNVLNVRGGSSARRAAIS